MDYDRNILMETYKVGRLLGQGTFAKVYYARNIKNEQSVAIKVIDKDKVMRNGIGDHVKREISVMRKVKHPNIVELYEVLATRWKIYFIMEYVKGGELFERLEKGKLQEDSARKIFQQLISAVDFCHSRGVYHRDLKLENLLLDENGDLKITDFGLSALVDDRRKDELLHTTCGTPAYVAPEVINRMAYYGDKADTWSCGVVLFALLSGYFPFHDSNMMELYRKIGIGSYKCPKWIPSDAKKLIARILDPEPSTRITIAEIKKNKWFQKGLDARKLTDMVEIKKEVPIDVATVFGSSSGSSDEGNKEVLKIENLTAFDIIASFSTGLDLSGLFIDEMCRKEVRFTSKSAAKTIISKFENLAMSLKMKVTKKHNGIMKLEGCKQGRKGTVGIDAEIFEITSTFHLVEMNKSSGDTLEYQKVIKEDIRPALEDIVWAWQDNVPIKELQ